MLGTGEQTMEHKCKKVDSKPIEKCELNANEIIKALECCAYGYCRDCYLYSDDGCGNKVLVGAINVIKQLTEENERLRAELKQRPPKLIITKLLKKENENV